MVKFTLTFFHSLFKRLLMLSRQPLPLTDFINNLQSFDIVLMKGLLVTSKEAQSITNSIWAHSGMVVVAGDLNLPGIDPTARLYWEANTADTATDLISNTLKEGPQLVYLEERIVHNYWVQYDGAFCARKLNYARQPSMTATLNQVMQATHPSGLPVVNGQYLELPYFLMGRFQNQVSPPGTFFCSQLVAHTYMALGLLTRQYPDNSYVPADFTEDVDVSLLNGAYLGREIYLDTQTIPPNTNNYKIPTKTTATATANATVNNSAP
jgi:hypothetical protein